MRRHRERRVAPRVSPRAWRGSSEGSPCLVAIGTRRACDRDPSSGAEAPVRAPQAGERIGHERDPAADQNGIERPRRDLELLTVHATKVDVAKAAPRGLDAREGQHVLDDGGAEHITPRSYLFGHVERRLTGAAGDVQDAIIRADVRPLEHPLRDGRAAGAETRVLLLPPARASCVPNAGLRSLGVLLGAQHLDADEGLVAVDPGVVARRDRIDVPGADALARAARLDRQAP